MTGRKAKRRKGRGRSGELTCYPVTEGDEPAEPVPADIHVLRHGYNLADIARLSRMSVAYCAWGARWDRRELLELAWSAIAEAVYAAPESEPPQPRELIWAAQDCIGRHVRGVAHDHGYDKANAGEILARFGAYWMEATRIPGPENRVTEHVALWQIWPALTDGQRSALLALAAAGTYQGAAEALGIAEKSLRNRVHAARRAFLELWHEHETPSRFWGSNRLVYRAGDPVAVAQDGRKAMKAVRHRKPSVPAREHQIRHGTAHAYSRWKCRCRECAAYKAAESVQRRRNAGIEPRRFITETEFAKVLRRKEAGDTWPAIASSTGFSEGYLRNLKRGGATPVPDHAGAA